MIRWLIFAVIRILAWTRPRRFDVSSQAADVPSDIYPMF